MTNNTDADAAITGPLQGNGSCASTSEAAGQGALDPEFRATVLAMQTSIQASIGAVVLSMMNLLRYRHLALEDLLHIVIQPLTQERLAIARLSDGGEVEDIVGIAIWASVSDAVDAKIREQVQAGVFPVRLGAEDWSSGDNAWLLDVIAPTQDMATALLANFTQVVKDRPVHIHPIVTHLVNPEVLEQLRIKPDGGSKPSNAA